MTACPNELELARAMSDDADPELTAHLAACATCSATWDATAQAIQLARCLEVPMPTADRREEMRTAILAASAALPAPLRARQYRPWLVGAAFAAAAALVVLLARPGSSAEPSRQAHGTVTPHPGARFVASSRTPDEVVTLHDGVIDVEVSPLAPGERFRVITADTEIDVRGTAFEVSAELGHLVSVQVRHGIVEVRPHGGAAVVLGAGAVWRAPIPTIPTIPTVVAPAPSPSPPAPAPGPNPIVEAPVRPASSRDHHALPDPTAALAPVALAPSSPPAAAPRDATAIAYDDAWADVRAGRFDRAAATLARVAILDPDGPLAEDAGYWGAVALARAKRPDALGAFRDFLDRYPRSSHAASASVALGWLLVDAKQPAEAERRFRAAIDTSNRAVSDSARAGLAAVTRR